VDLKFKKTEKEFIHITTKGKIEIANEFYDIKENDMLKIFEYLYLEDVKC